MEEHLYIIGNGFDLDLGYKTGYPDFLKSTFFTPLTENNSENTLAKHLISLYYGLNQSNTHDDHRWVDLEVAIGNYITNGNARSIEEFKSQFSEIQTRLKKYLSEVTKADYNIESRARYLVERIWKEHNNSVNIKIVDFNYTGKCNKLLKDFNRNSTNRDIDYIQAHGCLSDGFVLGVHDKALGIEHNDFCFIKKGFQPKYSNDTWHELYEKAKQITIFGHSLGESDKDVFIPLFKYLLNSPTGIKKNIKIYFKKGDEEQYYKRLDEILESSIVALRSKHKLELNPNDLNGK